MVYVYFDGRWWAGVCAAAGRVCGQNVDGAYVVASGRFDALRVAARLLWFRCRVRGVTLI